MSEVKSSDKNKDKPVSTDHLEIEHRRPVLVYKKEHEKAQH